MSGNGHTARWAILVASGIFLSRIAGLIRDRVFAHYFGNSDAADAFKAAFRIPNFLQNLFGEGALSASMIPAYAGLLAESKQGEARRLASAILALLALVISILVLAGILGTPWLVDVITPGFTGDKRELTIQLVRILFPGAGLLVLSAWCLGILNSHRRFFLSYAAPVIWNLAIIAALLGFGGTLTQYPLAEIAAWGAVLGSGLQFLVQLPSAISLLRGLPRATDKGSRHVKTVVGNFLPALVSRGVVQISAFVDEIIASLLPTGAMAALGYAQTLYLLPVSLFGMSISAAELPEMSSAVGRPDDVARHLCERLTTGRRRIAFFVVPSGVAFLTLGDVVAAAIYQTGNFTRADAQYVWAVLAGAALGLLAATQGRLYASGFYALRDTRTPLRFAIMRVVLAGVLAYFAALRLPELLQVDARWGIAGVTAASGFAAWVEFILLLRALKRRVGPSRLPVSYRARLWFAALLSAAAAWGIKLSFPQGSPVLVAIIVLGPYGILYLGLTALLNVTESRAVVSKLLRLPRRRPQA
ncbi:MAG: murein biosynthesis integral membrane protein MurJ [Gammaproteobacteria bacterium]